MNNTLIVKNSADVTTSENYLPTGPMAQWIRHLTTNQGIAGSSPARVNIFSPLCEKKFAPPGGLEPPTFRLTAERASRLRHGGLGGSNWER